MSAFLSEILKALAETLIAWALRVMPNGSREGRELAVFSLDYANRRMDEFHKDEAA